MNRLIGKATDLRRESNRGNTYAESRSCVCVPRIDQHRQTYCERECVFNDFGSRIGVHRVHAPFADCARDRHQVAHEKLLFACLVSPSISTAQSRCIAVARELSGKTASERAYACITAQPPAPTRMMLATTGACTPLRQRQRAE